MSGREFKPGDVALFRFSSGDERGMWDGRLWMVTGGKSRSANYVAARPLIVIDPEDAESVARLTRAFANPRPPKPEEPTGLGAVVEDAEGARWTRSIVGGNVTPTWSESLSGARRVYGDIGAVRVLSEGVQAGESA